MTPDDAAPLPGDLLLQAVEGMDRPLFVLDDDWRFRYVNPAGAAVLSRTVDSMVGGAIWEEFPETVDTPFERHYRRVAATGEPASFEAWFDPLQIWFQVDAFRTDGGLVVTYDDVTERRRTEEERTAAVAAREGEPTAARRPPGGRSRRGRGGRRRGRGGRPAPDAARRHQPGHDVDLRHRRGGRPVRPPRRAPAGRL